MREIWEHAATSKGTLPSEFNLKFFGSDLVIRVAFEIDATNYEEQQVAIFRYNGSLNVSLACGLSHVFVGRVATFVRLFAFYHSIYGAGCPCELRCALGDEGLDDNVLCFSSNVDGAKLVPDTEFMHRMGYLSESIRYSNAPSWCWRKPIAYFRGSDSGAAKYQNFLSSHRVLACLAVRGEPDHFDVKISGVEQRHDSIEAENYYKFMGIFSEREPQDKILEYQYQVDIDGNSNAWSAFFLKLLTGSPVLKIDSTFGYRQWFYDRMKSWKDFIPISGDSSNLVEVVLFLKKNADIAVRVGEAGRKLALSIDFRGEIERATRLMYSMSGR